MTFPDIYHRHVAHYRSQADLTRAINGVLGQVGDSIRPAALSWWMGGKRPDYYKWIYIHEHAADEWMREFARDVLRMHKPELW